MDINNGIVICPECNYKKSYKFMPLFLVSGASASGKSTVANYLQMQANKFVVLDMDILWAPHFDKPETQYKDFFETWLRLAKNISQSGLPVVLVGAGCIPDNIKMCVESRYFSKIYYLGLTCEDSVLEERLKSRPAWRKSSNTEFIEKQVIYNHYIAKSNEIINFKTDGVSTEEVADKMKRWIEKEADDERSKANG